MEFKIESGKTKEEIQKIVDQRLDKLYNEAPKRELVGFEKKITGEIIYSVNKFIDEIDIKKV